MHDTEAGCRGRTQTLLRQNVRLSALPSVDQMFRINIPVSAGFSKRAVQMIEAIADGVGPTVALVVALRTGNNFQRLRNHLKAIAVRAPPMSLCWSLK